MLNLLNNLCPCCSNKPYAQCCAPIIADPKQAKTVEQLMRSRYTAYTQANIEHIENTMSGNALENFSADSAKQWAISVQWQGLEVHASKTKNKTAIGFVEFTAEFIEDGKLKTMHEYSLFEKIADQWFYVDRRD